MEELTQKSYYCFLNAVDFIAFLSYDINGIVYSEVFSLLKRIIYFKSITDLTILKTNSIM